MDIPKPTKKYPLLSVQGIGQALKKTTRNITENIERQNRLKRELNVKVQEARRKAFEKEAIKQAQIKARMDAKLKYGAQAKKQQKQKPIMDDWMWKM